MVLEISASRKSTENPGEELDRQVRRRLRTIADAGFSVAFDHAPSGATNTLKSSFFEPRWVGRELRWGTTAPYATFVEEGTAPHWIPVSEMDDLERWARRVLGDGDAAWAVRHKIAQEGTEGQHFMAKGYNEMKNKLRREGIGTRIDMGVGSNG